MAVDIVARGLAGKNAAKEYTEGTSFVLETRAEYRLTDVTSLTVTFPESGSFEAWFRLTFAASGTITVSLPNDTLWIGDKPTFANGETWELSIKDGVAVAGKAVAD